MTESREKIKRLERLIQIRRIAVDEAESRVRQAESDARRFEARLSVEEDRIRQYMEEFAHPVAMTGLDLRQSERAAEAARNRARKIAQDVEKANQRLQERQTEWTEAQRERKTVEKLRERQLHHAVREEEALAQKALDDSSITRYRHQSD